MSHDADGPVPIVIATALREEGITGVHTHVRQLRRYLAGRGTPATLLTPFSWGGQLSVPVFGLRLVLHRISPPAGVAWYRYWHEVFLRRALRRNLATAGPCVIYAQGPPEARAALRARRGPHQRVVLAVHFRTSQADEWADKDEITRGGTVFRAIRRTERQVLPRVDGLVYVSEWARRAVLGWLPEARPVPSAVIGNFVAPLEPEPHPGPQADLVTTGSLELVKNHRFLLSVLAQARRRGQKVTLDIHTRLPAGLPPRLPQAAPEHAAGVPLLPWPHPVPGWGEGPSRSKRLRAGSKGETAGKRYLYAGTSKAAGALN